MSLYSAYGLNIESSLPLPELAAGRGSEDVRVQVEDLRDHVTSLHDQQEDFRVAAGEVCFFWNEIGAFVIRNGCEILVDPCPGVDVRWLRIGVLGPAFAALLQQRGYLMLHASAVRVGTGAVSFLGASGWGKSTLAAALHARGHMLVADDAIAVKFEADGPIVFPGAPQFKLWPDALAALGGEAEALPRINPDLDKRGRPVAADGFASQPISLSRVYLLSRGKRLAIEHLSRREAFFELVSHTYGIEWLHPVSGRLQFADRAVLVRSVPVRRLRRPWTLSGLDEVAHLVETDVAAATGTQPSRQFD